MLKTVTTPLGGSFTLDYTRAGNTTDHPGSVWTMTRLTVDDGYAADGPAKTSTFAYDRLRYDFVHRASLGFATVTTRELDRRPGRPRCGSPGSPTPTTTSSTPAC